MIRGRRSSFWGVGGQVNVLRHWGFVDGTTDLELAGYVLARELDKKKYRVVIVSPRTYFVFTPLLNDTTVGTLEFRNVLESIRKPGSGVEFIQGWADDINFADKVVTIEPSVLDPDVGHAMTGPRRQNEQQTASGLGIEAAYPNGPWKKEAQMGGTGVEQVPTFPTHYDKLVIAVGTYSETFGTKGVRENAWFLKDVRDAVAIRRRILELFELARLPVMPEETKKHLLHFAVVGGGPTGMEFAACLSDLIRQDISRMHPELMRYIRISLYDVAPKVLPMFDASLAQYAVNRYTRQNIEIKTSHQVEELRKGFPDDEQARSDQPSVVKGRVYTIRTKQEGDVGIGMCVWSTGSMNNPFVAKALNHVRRYPTDSAIRIQGEVNDPMTRQWIIQRDARSGIPLVDDHLRINLTTECAAEMAEPDKPKAYMKDVFALGDTAKLMSGPLPATAQVANQQAIWLGKTLNKQSDASLFAKEPPFEFVSRGVLAYLGGSSAIMQKAAKKTKPDEAPKGMKGMAAYLVWRGAYLSMTLSWRNRCNVAYQWLSVQLFGRDVSRF
jgi:NADH dehydrogenase FAD-containing subunit